MGLCKCPQRKITNIFCYEHRVNVCEHCLIQNHPKCVVDTYRNWITDSLYSTKCGLCNQELQDEETVRLMCLHLVHWNCLDDWARSLPATTAPAGYTCPICEKMCLFPAHNQISPIADVLRSKMSEVNWARAGLGLPPIPEDENKRRNQHDSPLHAAEETNAKYISSPGIQSITSAENSSYRPTSHQEPVQQHYTNQYNNSSNDIKPAYNGSSFVGSPVPSTGFIEPQTSSRKYRTEMETPLLIDEDENKYRRRPPLESITRYLKNIIPAHRRRITPRRYIAFAVIVFVVLLIVLMSSRRNIEDDDDAFNPRANPHVLIGEGPPIKLESR